MECDFYLLLYIFYNKLKKLYWNLGVIGIVFVEEYMVFNNMNDVSEVEN